MGTTAMWVSLAIVTIPILLLKYKPHKILLLEQK